MEDFILDIKFKNDAYTKSRGTPALLKISCNSCQHTTMYYQKDGPGPLKRVYFDRILLPEHLEQLQYKLFDQKTCPLLKCSHCLQLIGTPMIYEKEKRPAFLMIPESFIAAKIQDHNFVDPALKGGE